MMMVMMSFDNVYGLIQIPSAYFLSLVWYCMLWYHMVMYGMLSFVRVWYGMVWYSTLWYLIVCSLSILEILHSPVCQGSPISKSMVSFVK